MTTQTARPPLLLGLDVGTQSLRAALIDPHGRTVSRRGRADRDDLSAADLGRATAGRMVGGGRRCRSARSGPRRRRSRSNRRHRPRLHGVHRGGLRRYGPAPPPCPPLDGSACVPRGRRDQRNGRPGLALRLRPRLPRVDAPQGTLAQAQSSPRSMSVPSGSSNAPTG